MKEILKRFDQLDRKLEAELGGVRTDLERKIESEVGGLRSDLAARLAELEMRIATALLETVRSNHELVAELRQHRMARDERIDALTRRMDALEAKLG